MRFGISSEDVLKLFLIVILSGSIGYNREKSGMLVGIRTHILVGLSAVLLQIIALNFSLNSAISGDPTRLAGQMLSGIGFLGAGSILKDNKNIRGLTTAASIFFVACIGLAVGFGFYLVSIIVTTIGYLFLIDALRLKRHINNKKTKTLNLKVCYENNTSTGVRDILTIISDLDLEIASIDLHKSDDIVCVTLKLNSLDDITQTEIVTELSQLKNLTKILPL